MLPFFSSSADCGFAPLTYECVDPIYGTWEDIKAIGKDHYLMFDYMINHISAHSEYYLNFQQYKDASPYKDLFVRFKNFWPNCEPTQQQADAILRRKPGLPCVECHFADGTYEKVWCLSKLI